MSEKLFVDTIDKFFSELRPLTIEYDGRKKNFMVKPLSFDEMKEYDRIISTGTLESSKEGMDFLYRKCLRDEKGNVIWQEKEEVTLSPIARNLLNSKMLAKAIGNDITEFELKNLGASAS